MSFGVVLVSVCCSYVSGSGAVWDQGAVGWGGDWRGGKGCVSIFFLTAGYTLGRNEQKLSARDPSDSFIFYLYLTLHFG